MRKGEVLIFFVNILVGLYIFLELMYGCSILYIICNIVLIEVVFSSEFLVFDLFLKCFYYRVDI